MKNKKNTLIVLFPFILVAIIILGCSGSSSTTSTTPAPVVENTPVTVPEPEPEPEPVSKEFIDILKENMDESLAEHLQTILKDELGFTDLEFVEKQEFGDGNYTIKADGYELSVTAMPEEETEEEGVLEEYIRVFTSDDVLYEDGEILMSGADFIKKQDHEKYVVDNSSKFSIIAHTILESTSNYKIKFYSIMSADFNEIYGEQDGVVCVAGNCQVQNASGTYVKKEFIVQFVPTDLDNFEYEPTYVQLGNEKVGEAVHIETMYR